MKKSATPLIAVSLLLVVTGLLGCQDHHQALYKKKPAHYAYVVGDVASGKIQHAKAADTYATPASCQKMVTALTAYKVLGPEYRFKTRIYVGHTHQNKKFLVIQFSGDPSLTSQDLETLLHPLRGQAMPGGLYLDLSAFAVPDYSPNIMRDDAGTDYAPPVSAATIDQNLINVHMSASATQPSVQVNIWPTYPYHKDVTFDRAQPTTLQARWVEGALMVVGNVGAGGASLKKKIAPLNQKRYIGQRIGGLQKKLRISGKQLFVTSGFNEYNKAILVKEISSKPLKDLLPPAMKRSDNLYFDSFYLTSVQQIAAKKLKKWEEGHDILKAFLLDTFGVDIENAYLIDGSGLSRYNRIKPETLYQLLRAGSAMTDFYDSLARPGEAKSSLKKRTTLPATIAAKTGTLSGVSCLSGYNMKNGRPHKAFVVIGSGFCPPLKEFTQNVDAFIAKVVQ